MTEISNINLYSIIFMFKINSMLLNLCSEKLEMENSAELARTINSEIVDSLDTLKIAHILFKILSTSRSGLNAYINDIICITAYFTTKLFDIRPHSIQNKFMGFFLNDPLSQNFFRQCYEYIEMHKDKLANRVLDDFYKNKKFKDELSSKPYLVDKNLEKQIINLLKYFCFHDNKSMKDYIRYQEKSTKNYNLVKLIADYVCEFRNYIQYPVAFDTFISCLDALFEFVQGPNSENQDILIHGNFVDLCNIILMLDYEESNSNKPILNQIISRNPSTSKVASFKREHSQKQSSFKVLYDGLLHDTEDISLNTRNFMISLAKFKCVTVLLQVLAGREPTSYVYYLYRRVLDPELFRLNFAYTNDFRKRYNGGKYTMDLFFKYNIDFTKAGDSPLIIELGFRLFYLLMRMKENLYIDMDEKYYKKILVLLTPKTKSSSKVKKGIILESFEFIYDFYELITAFWSHRDQSISIEDVYSVKNDDNEMEFILKFFADHSSQIQILKDGILLNQYFPLLPYCTFSSEEPKEHFLDKVNRTNSKTKCESLMRESDYLIIDLKVNYWLASEKNRLGEIFQKHIDLWKNILLYLCFLLNGMILASYNILNGSRNQNPELGSLNSTQTKALFYAFGGFTLFLIATILINIFSSKIPITVKKHYKRIESDNKRKIDSGFFKLGKVGDIYNRIYYLVILILNIITNVQMLFFFGLLIMTILGLAVDPMYYTYLVSYLIYKSETLMSVLQAVWIPRYSILATIALLFIVTYVFTVFSYYYYASDYPDNTCYSLWSCFVISYDQSFKTGSGIGGYLTSAYFVNGSKESIRFGRVIYDNLQYLVIYVLLINLITGIIIDTFGDLRQKSYDRQEDAKSSCFICEKSREELEKEYGVNGFEYHTNSQHNLWDYLFFIAYLQTKMTTGRQLNTLERYTYEKILNGDQTWFPCYA